MTKKVSAVATPKKSPTPSNRGAVAESLPQMHAAHGYWRKDGDFSREELGIWQEELRRLEAGLDKVKDACDKHAKALQTHGASVTLYEQLWDEHEHALAEYEKGADGATLPALARQHQVEETKHDALREKHEQLKRRHHALAAALSLLEKAIERS